MMVFFFAVSLSAQNVNLLSNGDFESATNDVPVDWQMIYAGTGMNWSAESKVSRRGKGCLKLSYTLNDNQKPTDIQIKSKPFKVEPGQYYWFRGWLKADGEIPTNKAEGVVTVRMLWQDVAGKAIYKNERIYTLVNKDLRTWQMMERLFQSPTNAANAYLTIQVDVPEKATPKTIYWDDILIQKYQPLPPKGIVYDYPVRARERTTGINGNETDDSATKDGKAWHAERQGSLVSGPPITDQPPGQYQVVFRLKTDCNTNSSDLAVLSCAGGRSANWGMAARMIKGTDFVKPNEYQEFVVECLRPPEGAMGYGIQWVGSAGLWVDRIIVKEEKRLTDQELWELYGE